MDNSSGKLILDEIIEQEIELYSWENSIVFELISVKKALRESERKFTDVTSALRESERKITEISNSRSWRYTSWVRCFSREARAVLRKTRVGQFTLRATRRLFR